MSLGDVLSFSRSLLLIAIIPLIQSLGTKLVSFLWGCHGWHTEFIFRDAKQFTGLTDCQARDAQKLDFHFNASLTALNMAKWEQYQQRNIEEPFVFSMASYKRRKLNQHLLERFIHNLDLDETLIKMHPNYQTLCDYGLLVS
jgi:hypothetical protein